jgi:sporulation protein YlmC with PRC-barrel domain
MKPLKNMTGDALEQMIDYKVVDQNGKSIGSLHSLWSDPTTGGVEFLGVKTGWLFGHNHVVPAEKATVDEAHSVIRLPYTELFIKEAPSIAADAEISEVEEGEIYKFYGLVSPAQAAPQLSAEAVAAASMETVVPDAAGARWRRVAREDEASFETVVAPPDPAPGSREIGGTAQ